MPDLGVFSTVEQEDVDWDDSSKDYYAHPYQFSFLEHINFYLTEFDLRLVDFSNCENGYIFCYGVSENNGKKLLLVTIAVLLG